jgi:formyltetrahydrofolate deformylase
MNSDPSRSITMLISCPDQRGIVAAVTTFIAKHNGNVIDLNQHVDTSENVFFMRIEWEEAGFDVPRDGILESFRDISDRFRMRCELRFSDTVPRMALFVSKEAHCLYDVLSRVQAGEWNVEVPVIVGNHPDLKPVAEKFGVDFHLFPITKENKEEQEARELEMLRERGVDFVVLARYMQIVTPVLIGAYPNRIINIHHSFLPAFAGAKPYHAAYARGVKIIGATSHYVTAELDTGPIIEQDIIRVSHKDSLEDLIRKGKDLEKIVLARAIYHHLQNKILVYSNKTVVFE